MSPQPLVTISAPYGAGGSRVGPLLAEQLGVPFAERIMRRPVADRVAGPLAQARQERQPVGRSLGRMLRQVAGERPRAPITERAEQIADAEYRRAHEEELRGFVDEGAVILGRAAAVVLRDVSHAVHVRLSGPAELRVQQAMKIEDLDHATARWRQVTEDLARDTYVRHFHGVDPEDAAFYHLTIDSTRLSLEACVESIAAAARAVT
ncbi:MAG: cytidylate kinase-like family protein [Actinomycetota bacterium]|nr:cytidylate kinase-like family protein [Actinomycetota bacterium]